MMRSPWILALGTFALVGLAELAAQAGARQSYGNWQYNKDKNYYYREYRYKANANDADYHHQYAIYFKNDNRVNNKWIYFYNPMTQKYWGRYPTVHNEKYRKYAEERSEAWSVLPKEYRQKDIYQIEQKHWPTPRTDYCPTIPDASDGALMLAPPPDLP